MPSPAWPNGASIVFLRGLLERGEAIITTAQHAAAVILTAPHLLERADPLDLRAAGLLLLRHHEPQRGDAHLMTSLAPPYIYHY